MASLKVLLKKYVPGLYSLLVRIKDFFMAERWGNYYDASDPSLHVPERCLVALRPEVPAHITRFLNLGCGAGRDFIPFDGTMSLWGIDLVPFQRIQWVQSFKDLRYEQMKIEDFTRRLETGSDDLTHTLVYASGTLMYLSEGEQTRFLDACRARGCTNFIFQEFAPNSKISPEEKLRLPTDGFTKHLFRKEGEELPTYVFFK